MACAFLLRSKITLQIPKKKKRLVTDNLHTSDSFHFLFTTYTGYTKYLISPKQNLRRKNFILQHKSHESLFYFNPQIYYIFNFNLTLLLTSNNTM